MEGILREERVLVGSISPEEGLGALDKSTLHATLKLEHRISETLSGRGIPCLQTRTGSCFALSPLVFWNYDEQMLASDVNVLDTLNMAHNISISGVPITPDMVLAGRELLDPHSDHIDAAMFLVLTYFFPETDCFSKEGHFKWLHALEDATGSAGELVVLAQEPRLIALEVSWLCPRMVRLLTLLRTVSATRISAQRLHYPVAVHVCDIRRVQHLLLQTIPPNGHGALSYWSRVHGAGGDRRQHDHQCQCLRSRWLPRHDGAFGVVPDNRRVHWRGEYG